MQSNSERDDSHPLANAVAGAIAGAAATWVMGKVTEYLYAKESNAVRKREDSARGGRTAFGGAAGGLGVGAAFWALMDEGAVYALGLAPGPWNFPWQTHARGLAGHLVFGAVTDSTLSVLQKAA